MKKIINGKMYNTETAECIASDKHGSSRDFGFWKETLFRKKNGEFFLVGCGGPASHYRKQVGQNEWSGDERIVPMTEAEARGWVEKHLEADEYIELFGEVEE